MATLQLRQRMAARARKGAALPVFLVMVMAILIVLSGLLYASTSAIIQVNIPENHHTAYLLAMSGMEHALSLLQVFPQWREGFTDEPLGKGSYTVTVEDVATNVVEIVATGKVNDTSQTLRGRYRVVPHEQYRDAVRVYGDHMILPDFTEIEGDVYAYGNVEAGEYNIFQGDIRATGSITMTETAVIEGNLYPGSGIKTQPLADAERIRAFATQVHDGDATFVGMQDYDDDLVFVDGDAAISGVIRGRVTFYVTGTVSILGDLTRDPDDPESAIAVIAQADASGIDPSRVAIMVMGAGTGGRQVEAFLVTRHCIHLGGGTEIVGGVIAGSLSMDAQGVPIVIRHDPTFANHLPPLLPGNKLAREE